MRLLLNVLLLLVFATPASAWKPTTHVFLAEQALADAEDGYIEVPILGTDMVLTYPVEPMALEAILKYRPYYRSGVLGPDAYPDIATGQMGAHPGFDDSGVEGGTDAWLTQVWGGFSSSARERAFRLGYLTHAAGDIFAHSFINRFSGGPFTIGPNAAKHVIIEGYVDKRLPADKFPKDMFEASISGIEATIYTVMIEARPDNAVSRILPNWGSIIPVDLPEGPGRTLSVFSMPRTFTSIRKFFVEYVRKKKVEIAECSLLDKDCSKVLLTALVAYIEAWIDDIDTGLEALPAFSHSVAINLFFNPQRKMLWDNLAPEAEKYWNLHLSSMLGAPDFVGENAQAISDFAKEYMPEAVTQAMATIKSQLAEVVMATWMGKQVTEVKEFLESPELHFEIMSRSDGKHITLAEFNREELGIDDPGFEHPELALDPEAIHATYNTILLSKLVLLSKDSINELLHDLDSPATLTKDNVMLGFVPTLDGDRQWNEGLVLAATCDAYNLIFKPLTDMPCLPRNATED